jgi:hypothetical protein
MKICRRTGSGHQRFEHRHNCPSDEERHKRSTSERPTRTEAPQHDECHKRKSEEHNGVAKERRHLRNVNVPCRPMADKPREHWLVEQHRATVQGSNSTFTTYLKVFARLGTCHHRQQVT